MPADYAHPFAFRTEDLDGTRVLHARGFLDARSYVPLRDAIIAAALNGPRAVIIDVTTLVVAAPSAWAAITSARWHVTRWPDVPIALACAHPEGRAAIGHSVGRHVPVYPSVRQAIDALPNPGRSSDRPRRRVALPATPASVARSRELIAEWLIDWQRPDPIFTAKLVVTVLVENVLKHTDSVPVIRLEISEDVVTVAVEDHSTAPAVRREWSKSGGDEVSGLAIVAALCRSWGNAPTSSGKAVWAAIGPENHL
ncbi:sulfate transporter [Mycobacterium sp.]|uniref:sulfate transporter n=1 Tax=Mycobacterium sp. TaxID=1785 RepID=UPI002CA061EC|nr:sulfate transporter [Mycobacterium sp.]HME46624.1 sulfate transporter [Mycobacterium sp.]